MEYQILLRTWMWMGLGLKTGRLLIKPSHGTQAAKWLFFPHQRLIQRIRPSRRRHWVVTVKPKNIQKAELSHINFNFGDRLLLTQQFNWLISWEDDINVGFSFRKLLLCTRRNTQDSLCPADIVVIMVTTLHWRTRHWSSQV